MSRERLEEELRRQAREHEEEDQRWHEFVRALTHELRTPLATLDHLAEVIRVGQSATDWKWAAGVLERQTRLILGMLDRLHDVSRLAQGKLTLHRQRLDLAALARRAAEGQRGAFAEAGVGLDMEAPEAVWVDGDPDRLAQVVRELLDNAYRFTDRGGRVVVKLVRGADGRAELSVRDTGPGVGAAFLPRIFEPFAQADDNRQRGRKGLGVGLALVRGLAELHGGSVWAESPGQGTAVTVRLPAAAEGQAS